MIEIILIAVFLLFSSVFSASETAFSTLSRPRLQVMANEKKRGAERALKISEDYDALISSILIGNNVVNIALSSVATVFFIRLIGNGGSAVSTIVITLLVLIFGEITPKSLAKDFPEKFACFVSPFLNVLIIAFKPFNFLFSKWGDLLAKMFGVKEESLFTSDELLALFDEGEKDGSLDPDENELLSNTVEFLDCHISDVLTPKNKMVAVDIKTPKDKIAKVFEETEYSRLPVYNKSINNIVGFLHSKDFFTHNGISKEPIGSLLSKSVFVKDTDEAGDVLKVMQKKGIHMCIVRDKDNKLLGIVTMEDLIEEIVGEIEDEFD
ncbi:MAG: HlyC/CorC family transporter [Lachnospiraceae bacterium]|nr:HlyC/CorC family transporter [Lachnospiraceae bacterium]